MTAFHTRHIRKKPPSQLFRKIKNKLADGLKFLTNPSNKKQKNYILGAILAILGAMIVFKVTAGVYQAVKNFDPRDMFFSLGSELKKDQNGYTNLVLLGDGGHERDGADLVDTIMVASIDFKNKSVSLLSLPRDLYIKTEDYGASRINEFYRHNKNKLGEDSAYEVYQEIASLVTNLDIQYYARLDFKAFVEVVDALGGITIDVKKPLYDPFYPNETDDGYTVFQVNAGIQEMNGETALKFTRSRKTTSDFDRAFRQQQVLMAIRDKAVSGKILTSPSAIKRLYQSVSKNLNTNLTLQEMISLAELGKNFDQSRILSKVLHDDPAREGGFLYTPERKYYNDQFVLIPDGDNFDLIHRYADLVFHRREVLMNPANIEMLNATKKPGLARVAASYLTRFGFKITKIDNFTDSAGKPKYLQKSFLRYYRWTADKDGNVLAQDQAALDALTQFINGAPMPSSEAVDPAVPEDQEEIDITIALGEDYKLY